MTLFIKKLRILFFNIFIKPLRPHDGRLLSSSAQVQISAMLRLITIISIVEALSWAYGWSRMSTDILYQSIIGVIAFTFIFALTFNIDSRFAAQDTIEQKHDNETTEKKWFKKCNKIIALRLVIAAVSIFGTMAFLEIWAFNSQIQLYFDQKDKAQLNVTRDQLTKEHDQIVSKLAIDEKSKYSLWQTSMHEVVAESARHGCSVVCNQKKTLSEEQKKQYLESKRNLDEAKARNEKLQTFDQAVISNNQELLQRQFGVLPVARDTMASFSALLTIAKQEGFNDVRFLVASLSPLLLLGLWLLKMSASASVRLYYHEEIQSNFIRYLSGDYNHLLDSRFQSSLLSNQSMDARSFTKLWEESIVPELERERANGLMSRAIQARHIIDGYLQNLAETDQLSKDLNAYEEQKLDQQTQLIRIDTELEKANSNVIKNEGMFRRAIAAEVTDEVLHDIESKLKQSRQSKNELEQEHQKSRGILAELDFKMFRVKALLQNAIQQLELMDKHLSPLRADGLPDHLMRKISLQEVVSPIL